MADEKKRERAPTCKVCGERHWQREPHVWGGKAKKKKAPK